MTKVIRILFNFMDNLRISLGEENKLNDAFIIYCANGKQKPT